MIIAASICQCQKNVKSPANNTGSGQRPHPVAYKHVANLTQSDRKRTGYQSIAAMNAATVMAATTGDRMLCLHPQHQMLVALQPTLTVMNAATVTAATYPAPTSTAASTIAVELPRSIRASHASLLQNCQSFN